MKKIVFHSCYEELNLNNYLFKNENVEIGDDLLRPFIKIKEKLTELNIEVDANILLNYENVLCYVFIDEPNYNNIVIKKIFKGNSKKYLIHLESPIIKKINHEKHALYQKIFTYDDSMVDDKKYIKINYSFEIKENVIITKRNKLCALISSNKKSNAKNELYSLRINDADIFYRNEKNSINLYGFGWDKYLFSPVRPYSIINRFNYIRKIIAKIRYPYYIGAVKRKKNILERYKFSICYENVHGVNGYITEKIFDSMFSGCIPIYLGAPNIRNYVPHECFIDRGRFKTAEELYLYLINMPELEYINYIKAINLFLQSDNIKQFTCTHFARTIVNNIL